MQRTVVFETNSLPLHSYCCDHPPTVSPILFHSTHYLVYFVYIIVFKRVMEKSQSKAAAAAPDPLAGDDEETSETVEDDGWVRAVQENVDTVATYSNTRYTKVLVLTDQNQDKNFQTLKRYRKTKRIFFMQEPLSGPGWDKEANKVEESRDGRKAFLERVEKHNPSVLIIASEHYPATLPVLRDFYDKSCIRDDPLATGSDFFIVETREM